MPPSIDDTARPAGSVVEWHGSAPFVTERVGAVGLGHMGHAFAVNLVEDGYRVLVYDRDPAQTAALTGAGIAGQLAELAACDVVLTFPSQRRRAGRGRTGFRGFGGQSVAKCGAHFHRHGQPRLVPSRRRGACQSRTGAP
jgi:hypothetical protein